MELLLTLVLILCLAAASVFTFTAIYQTANLDEGSDRFQTLVRFAQAEAATTGRKVRLQFVPSEATPVDVNSELRAIKVTWEADLLNAPGVFEEYTNKAWSEEIVNELVGVTKVEPMTTNGDPMPMEEIGTVGGDDSAELISSDDFPAITFYPDGTCDSAEVVLASRNSDDDRRFAVRLGGMLGTVTTRTISADQESIDAEAAAFEECNDIYESSVPVSESASYSDYSVAPAAGSYGE